MNTACYLSHARNVGFIYNAVCASAAQGTDLTREMQSSTCDIFMSRRISCFEVHGVHIRTPVGCCSEICTGIGVHCTCYFVGIVAAVKLFLFRRPHLNLRVYAVSWRE